MNIASEETVLAWQGVPVQVKYGYCIVEPDKEKPLYWWNYHCRETGICKLAAICVNCDGYVFCIYNGHGIGWFKLSKGGWPDEGHSHLPVDTFTEDNSYEITEYDRLSFQRELYYTHKWRKENYPEEYKRVEALLEIGRRPDIVDLESLVTIPELPEIPYTTSSLKPKHHNGRYNKVNRSKNKASRKARKQNRT